MNRVSIVLSTAPLVFLSFHAAEANVVPSFGAVSGLRRRWFDPVCRLLSSP